MKNILKTFSGLLLGMICFLALSVNASAGTTAYYNISQGGTWDGTHCYDSNGKLVHDSFFSDGKYTYFLQTDGTPMIDRLTYHPDGVHVIYFDSQGHEVFSNFANVKKTIAGENVDDYCFFDVYGYLYVDVVTYDQEGKELYYANECGVMPRGKWFRFSDKVKCADGTPWAGAAGNYGYAYGNGTLAKNEAASFSNGQTVIFEGNGVAKDLVATDELLSSKSVSDKPAPAPDTTTEGNPNDTFEKGWYIGNKNNGKLHYYTCSELPFEHNRIYFESEAAANAAGYTNRHVECMPHR